MNIHNNTLKLVIFISVLLLISGCSAKYDDVYNTSIQKGLDAIAEDDLSKAEGLFEMALETKKEDKTAQAYLDQVKLILEAENLQDKNQLDDAIKLLEESINIKDGSKVISSKSNEKKESILLYKENQTNYNSLLASAMDFNKNQEFEKSNEKLDELLQSDLSQFITIKDEAIKLRENNNTEIKNAEIAHAEKVAAEAKAKAEKEAKAKAEEQANNPFAWNPGIKEEFEKAMIESGYVSPEGYFLYRDGFIGGDGQGYFALYTIDENGEERYVVVVNVKTGWYHG